MLDEEHINLTTANRPRILQYVAEFLRTDSPSKTAMEIVKMSDAIRQQLINEWPDDGLELLWRIYNYVKSSMPTANWIWRLEFRFMRSAPSHVENVNQDWERLARSMEIRNRLKNAPLKACSCNIDLDSLTIKGTLWDSKYQLICPNCGKIVSEQNRSGIRF
jgi:hypothetical protein